MALAHSGWKEMFCWVNDILSGPYEAWQPFIVAYQPRCSLLSAKELIKSQLRKVTTFLCANNVHNHTSVLAVLTIANTVSANRCKL